jgi:hypothetical protein
MLKSGAGYILSQLVVETIDKMETIVATFFLQKERSLFPFFLFYGFIRIPGVFTAPF